MAGDPGRTRPFLQVDVFGAPPLTGNPVAVVLEAAGLTDTQMQQLARWTNLSETTFVFPPTDPGADYLVRIFTPSFELPFAGHPTLGTCHAWLEEGGQPRQAGHIVQQCAAGPVTVRRGPTGLAFAAPPLVREGPVDAGDLARATAGLGIDPAQVVDAAWVDNGPGWIGLLLPDAAAVLAVRPGSLDTLVGVVGPHPAGAPAAFEVRAFFPARGVTVEDPVTGSLNASLAQWLIGSGRALPPYRVAQGSAVGAQGQVLIDADSDGTVWVGGQTVTVVRGQLDL